MTRPGKPLNELLAGIAPADANVIVRGLSLDSRSVGPGALFIALPGARRDGRAYIPDAVARGAAAVVYDAEGFDPGRLPVPAVAVARLAEHAGTIADRFYDSPSRRVTVIGVTGTNGKTTCTQLAAQALDRPPRRCAVIGTLGYGFPGALDLGLHTTPDAVTVQRLLSDFAARGAAYAAMEVSSHALEQGRVQAVAFAAAVFTNLSRDHLDYHRDMARYAAAKARLFRGAALRTAIVNCDDEHGRRLIATLRDRVRVLSYGLDDGDVHARALQCGRDGVRLRAATPQGEVEIDAPLFGRFNAANLLAALATLIALGLDAAEAARRLSAVAPVPGRVEPFQGAPDRPVVVVDYAHTPDALEQVLRELRAHVTGRLWCVFGCGGERDPGKRPQMGATAERLADAVILTDDNPRGEPGDAIVRDIVAGMGKPARVIRERRTAIATALAEAGADDVVLIAGKGHEDYQQIGDARLPYSDRETVRALLGSAA